ncbi:hypothetical protein C8Q74DRAFT_1367047 [Fomes fomentarius]|nr:hypothetical protein C8Q74DRAFT_1367047 [Fomes fomentarius]
MATRVSMRFHRSSSQANTRAEVNQDSKIVFEAWREELKGRIHIYKHSTESYLDTFVPCSTPYIRSQHKISRGPFSSYLPKKGQEKESYPGLLAGLNKLVSSFEDDCKLTFHATHDCMMSFPFDAFAENHHKSAPDIAVSFPGDTPSLEDIKSAQWQRMSTVLEVKTTSAKDPFATGRKGNKHQRTAIQLARNARNLLLAHGSLAVIVLGIYGTTARIARFDHTSAVVSQPFDIKQQPHLLQRFFWHFTHPCVGTSVVGCDPTCRKLSVDDEEWVKSQLRRSGMEDSEVDTRTTEFSKGRRVEVYNELDGSTTPYLLYQLIDVNARLFSRATTVWRALEDTRILDPDGDGTLIDNPTTDETVRTVIYKEAWRQLVRISEVRFYERMTQAFTREDDWVGLPRFIGGGDQGVREVRSWMESSPNLSVIEGKQGLRLQSTDASSASSSTDSSPSSSQTTEEAEGPFPLPYPQHQTFSWAIGLGKDYTSRERSQMRMVVADVGRPLNEFESTFQVVLAIMKAIEGHKSAWEIAGILHRDISLGNILIAEDSTRGGFLHDFDYSSMTEVIPGRQSDPVSAALFEVIKLDDHRKERTGTFYYMAVAILGSHKPIVHDVHHDLESAYWVLLRLVLRHTEHTLGQEVCKDVFILGNDRSAAAAKSYWILFQARDLVVEGNAPLTTLLLEFRSLLHRSAEHPNPAEILNHDSVLEIFRKAISQEKNWPKDDFVKCTLLDRHIGTAVAGATGTTGLGDDDDSLDVDVPIEEEDDDDVEDPEEEDGTSDDEIEAAGLEEALEALEADVAIGRGVDQDKENGVGAPLARTRSHPAATRGDGPRTRAQTKREAAGPAEPASVPQAGPSNSGGSSKRRKLNASAPPRRTPTRVEPKRRGSRNGGRGKRSGPNKKT